MEDQFDSPGKEEEESTEMLLTQFTFTTVKGFSWKRIAWVILSREFQSCWLKQSRRRTLATQSVPQYSIPFINCQMATFAPLFCLLCLWIVQTRIILPNMFLNALINDREVCWRTFLECHVMMTAGEVVGWCSNIVNATVVVAVNEQKVERKRCIPSRRRFAPAKCQMHWRRS